MMRIGTALLLSALILGGCVKDQQAARTRNSGVDKEPEKHETPTPEKVPADDPPKQEPPPSEDLPPVEKPQ
jgi:PBP1b-binding outer membrane lipoprotein LpoB